MIPAALAILIYQILAILGAEAVSQIVTGNAYRKRDLDFRLMYSQGPLDLIMNYNRFDQTKPKKVIIILFATLTVALKFIPTILTKLNSSGSIYYNPIVTPLGKPQADSMYNCLLLCRSSSLDDMLNSYLKANLGQNTTQNSGGHWFTPQINKNFKWDDHQTGNEDAFYSVYPNGSISSPTIMAFGVRPSDSIRPSFFTISTCRGPTAVREGFPPTHGNDIKAAVGYGIVCYPTYDNSLSVLYPLDDGTYETSLLNINDTIYRQIQLSQGTVASSSFGVNVLSQNSTHTTMGMKKTAHITLYTYNETAILPSNCPSGNKTDYVNNFIDLPYDAVLCDLINIMSANNTLRIIQAASRNYTRNSVMNTVYTIQKGITHEVGASVMLDFSSFQVFNVEGNLARKKEHMVAYSSNNLRYEQLANDTRATDLSNDKIGSILKQLDPSYIDEKTVDILVGMTAMRVRWENGDYSDFALNQSEVMDAVQTPTWWIITVSILALVFVIPQLNRLIVRRIPEYAENLRNLLLLTIERSHASDGAKNVKHVGIIQSEKDDETDRMALLSVNGYPVSIAEKPASVEANLIDEKYIHS